MNKIKIPEREFLVKHLRELSQYSQSKKWFEWYAKVAIFKGLRTVKMLKEYKGYDSRLLDLGCGAGITLTFLAQAYERSVGCDIDRDAIEATRRILERVGVKASLVKYGGDRLPFRSNSFDIVTSIEVIEHAKDPEKMLSEIKRVLKPDGILHVTTANKWWPYEPHYKLLFLSYLPRSVANWYVRLSGRGEHYEDIKLPSYDGFRRMVGQYFLIEDVTLSMIKDYKKYSFDEERGFKVVIVGETLRILDKLKPLPVLKYVPVLVSVVLVRVSLGWLFICQPRRD